MKNEIENLKLKYRIQDDDPVFVFMQILEDEYKLIKKANRSTQETIDNQILLSKMQELNTLKLQKLQETMSEDIAKDITSEIEGEIEGFYKTINELKNQALSEIEHSRTFVLNTAKYVSSLPDNSKHIHQIEKDTTEIKKNSKSFVISMLLIFSSFNFLMIASCLIYYFMFWNKG